MIMKMHTFRRRKIHDHEDLYLSIANEFVSSKIYDKCDD